MTCRVVTVSQTTRLEKSVSLSQEGMEADMRVVEALGWDRTSAHVPCARASARDEVALYRQPIDAEDPLRCAMTRRPHLPSGLWLMDPALWDTHPESDVALDIATVQLVLCRLTPRPELPEECLA